MNAWPEIVARQVDELLDGGCGVSFLHPQPRDLLLSLTRLLGVKVAA